LRARNFLHRFIFSCTTGYYLLVLLQLSVPGQAQAGADLPIITICYNYSCKRTALVRPAADEWQLVIDQFRPAAHSATAEREMIRHAIAMLESIAGKQTPTFRDRGRNPIVDDWPGQMDCIDESTNTKHYLDLLQDRGLLHWHRVAERAYRAPYILDQHWAGQITELATLDNYVIDSWHLDNGYPPYVQTLRDWLRKRPF